MDTLPSATIPAAFSVSGQCALVTGAAGAIGWAITRAFGQNGARVMLSDRDGEALHARLHECAAAGIDARAEPADLTVPGDLDRLVAATLAAYGRIDTLVNCGAVTASAPWPDESAADFDRLYHTNVRSAWLLTRAVAKSMIGTGGAVVSISSINGHRAAFPCSLYAGTKAALMAITRDLAIELAPHAIRVNSVSPGLIAHTDRESHWVNRFLKAPWADEAFERTREQTAVMALRSQPLARIGEPDDIAWACVYLCSPAGRFVTGTDLIVDGGKLQEMPDYEARFDAKRADPAWVTVRAWMLTLPDEAWLSNRRPRWLNA